MQRDGFITTTPVCIQRGTNDLINVHYNNTFLEECTYLQIPYDVSTYRVATAEMQNRSMRKSVTKICLLTGLSFLHSKPVLKVTCIREISETDARGF